jgi:hypothetical protein
MGAITHAFTNPKADGPDATIVRPSNWNENHTLTNIAQLDVANTFTATGNRFKAPITNDTNADTMFTASAAGKRAAVFQFGHATPTVDLLQGQMSDGTRCFSIQSDGGVIIDQRTGATFGSILDVRYQGAVQFLVGFSGDATVTRDFVMSNATGRLNVGGGRVFLASAAVDVLQVNNGTVNTYRDLKLRDIFTTNAILSRSTVAYTNGAGAGAGTITNAPAAGNPTKWIPVDDNGTTRYVPAW